MNMSNAEKTVFEFTKTYLGAKIANIVVHMYHDRELHYHNIEHIRYCLLAVGRIGALNEDLLQAIVFHDIIMDGPNPERRSAEFYKLVIGKKFKQGVYDAIVNTELSILNRTYNHFSIRSDGDIDIVSKLNYVDFCGLWSSPVTYLASESRIGEEYNLASSAENRKGRIKFLQEIKESFEEIDKKYYLKHTESINLRKNIEAALTIWDY